jgi:protein SCO1
MKIILPILSLLLANCAFALNDRDLASLKFDQHPGAQVSGDLVFKDENNQPFRLGDHLGKQPTILVLGYYGCPMLCNYINDGLIAGLQDLRYDVSRDFQVLNISIDPTETAAQAATKRAQYLRRYGRHGADAGWHCLIGDQQAINQLTTEVGFRYAWDPQTRQYAHPSGVVFLTPDGRISRYVFGVTFNARDLRDALLAARDGKSSSVVSQILLLCYHYNPITGKYGAAIMMVMRIASLVFVALIGWWLFSMSRRPAKTGPQPG